MVSQAKPRGEEAVRAALVQAAERAYAEGGFTARKVAQRAGVNHGQVHHYFGGMDGLKQAVLEQLGEELDARIEEEQPANLLALLDLAVSATLENKRFVLALARRVLEAPGAGNYQVRFPVVRRLKSALRGAAGPEGDVLLAEGLARTLGWALFGGWIAEAVGLDACAVERVRQRLAIVTEGAT